MGRSSRLALSLLCGSLLMCGNSFEAGGDGGPGGDDSGSSSGGADSGSSSGGGSGGSSGSSSGGGSGGGSGGSSGGDDSGSVEGGGPWTPAMLPGLVVWLDDTKGVVASTTIKGAITRWLDQSGAGNDATPTNTQGAAGSNFTVDPAVVHGHDAILCPGNGTYLDVPDAITLRFGTGDFGIVAVGRYEGSIDVWDKIDPAGGAPGLSFGVLAGNYFLNAVLGSKVVLAQTNPTQFHIVAARGAHFQLTSEGTATSGPPNTTDLSFPGGPGRICGSGQTAVVNELAELLVVKGTLTDVDLAKAVVYLRAKFGL